MPHTPRHLLALIAAIQFTCILDFMMVLPMAPDIATRMGFSAASIGWLTSAYGASAVLGGLISIMVLDRFDRRIALGTALAGLALGTLAAGMAQQLGDIIAARALTGFFAAPAGASAMALVLDATPPARRGKVVARVMIGFSLATIVGIPAVLELSNRWHWQLPFFIVAALALVECLLVFHLPAMRSHIDTAHRASLTESLCRPLKLLRQRGVGAACLLQSMHQFSAFLVIPSFSAFYLLNLDFARNDLGLLYLAGGVVSLFVIQLAGPASDRFGPWPAAVFATVAVTVGLTPMLGITSLPAVLCFVLFMSGNAARNVSLMSVVTHAVAPPQRAGFMALLRLFQDLAMALAAHLSAQWLATRGGQLVGMDVAATAAAAGAVAVLLLLWRAARVISIEHRAPEAAAPSPVANR